MALNVGSLPVTGVYSGSTEVQKVYVGADLVWENRETVMITGTSGTEARDSFRAALSARGLDYRTVETVPFWLDTSSVTNMRAMFEKCSSLTSVPDMDTSNVEGMVRMFNRCSSLTSVPDINTGNVTNMRGMFQKCSSLTSVPDMDTSNVTDMSYMFNGCSSLTSVSDMDTGNVTNMSVMFQRCAALTSVSDMNTSNVTEMIAMFWGCEALTDGNVRLIGKNVDVNTSSMIDSSGLTRLPFYDTSGGGGDEAVITGTSGTEARDSFRAALAARGLDYKTVKTVPFLLDTSKVTNMRAMFDSCSSLTSVPDMDTSNVTDMSGMFSLCSSLESVPDMNTRNVTSMVRMFFGCSSITDGNVRCIGKNTSVETTGMIDYSGLTRLPFYDTNGNWTG